MDQPAVAPPHLLLTLLPPLPPLGETPPLTLAEALGLLRQQGGADLELLAGLLEAESLLREALDEWVVNPPGSRVVPAHSRRPCAPSSTRSGWPA